MLTEGEGAWQAELECAGCAVPHHACIRAAFAYCLPQTVHLLVCRLCPNCSESAQRRTMLEDLRARCWVELWVTCRRAASESVSRCSPASCGSMALCFQLCTTCRRSLLPTRLVAGFVHQSRLTRSAGGNLRCAEGSARGSANELAGFAWPCCRVDAGRALRLAWLACFIFCTDWT